MNKVQSRYKLFHDGKSLLVKTKRVGCMIFINLRDIHADKSLVKATYTNDEHAEKAYSQLSNVIFKLMTTGCNTYADVVNKKHAYDLATSISEALEAFSLDLVDIVTKAEEAHNGTN
jgi:glucan phosphorylase